MRTWRRPRWLEGPKPRILCRLRRRVQRPAGTLRLRQDYTPQMHSRPRAPRLGSHLHRRREGRPLPARPQRHRDGLSDRLALPPYDRRREHLLPSQGEGLQRPGHGGQGPEVAKLLSIEGLLDKAPRELSGGEQQRVEIGRAIAREPKAFLMDEPLSSLDSPLRAQLRAELKRIQREVGATILYVAHDQAEASLSRAG